MMGSLEDSKYFIEPKRDMTAFVFGDIAQN